MNETRYVTAVISRGGDPPVPPADRGGGRSALGLRESVGPLSDVGETSGR